ncbi:MAG TPA: ABC transporter ATP-binding protein [Stellaceae bacterium]|nr:ABC transporter ATP-binding protein [Stellaceae bacterium]
MSALLDVAGLNKSFGAVVAANDINVSVAEGERIGIIGANGAGKTTFVNLVTGYLKPSSGSIAFLGRDITPLPPRAIIAAGISRSFQVPQVFTSASVADNLLIACGIAEGGAFPLWQALRRPARLAVMETLLERFGIADYRDQPALLLSQGVRKLLDIAMATVRAPRLLLLDEPTSGISAEEKFAIMDVVMGATQGDRRAVMFVEHDLDIIQRYATRVLAFAEGTIIAEGAPAAVIADAKVRRYILGDAAARRHAAGAAP